MLLRTLLEELRFLFFWLLKNFSKTGTFNFLVLSVIAGKVYGIIHLVRSQNFPQNENFLPPDTLTYVRLSGRKNFFFENFVSVINEWSPLKKHTEICCSIDLFFENEYRPLATIHCSNILSRSCYNKKIYEYVSISNQKSTPFWTNNLL